MSSLNRIVMNRCSQKLIQGLQPKRLEAAEISGKWGRQFPFRSYERFHYPAHDICAKPVQNPAGAPRQFDLVLANQVWEHLDRPYEATLNVIEMLRPGGYFWLAVPFFIPFHAAPKDNSRWSATGLRNLLIECGFAEQEIVVDQWGNRPAALRNLEPDWPPQYDPEQDTLDNDPDFPICAWALARKTSRDD